ncbi:hypothetical protein B0T21DRAFT_414037 [Apiosordaria backusii]|uniref:Uncharacterized protein n=1 Tax=Apiosordaria backusii TaxID=314023 RepID=A0AA40E3G8_9PEZI|nr:hypothetical protein B0T21DRAFT_414037 [Apiosordaria backusii]
MGNNNNNNRTKIQDDPNTTTTTDWDSGDSEGVDYVYQGHQKSSPPSEKRTVKARNPRSPRRKRSPKGKPRCHKCVCGATVPASTADEDVGEETVFELDTDSENEGAHRSHPTRPKSPTPEPKSPTPEPKSPTPEPIPQPTPESQDKGRKVKKKKSASKKSHHKRSLSPYIEEYPEQATRPAILLREHKVPRRFSTSDARRAVDTMNPSSPTSSSRGRSPPAKRFSAASSDKAVRPSPKRPSHRRHQLASLQSPEGEHPLGAASPKTITDNDADRDRFPNFGNAGPEMEGTGPPTPRQHHHVSGTQIPPNIARTSAWVEHQPQYSSSWPLNPGFHHPPRQSPHQPPQQDLQYDSDDESDHEPPHKETEFLHNNFPRPSRQSSFMVDRWQMEEELQREREWEKEQERERARQLERERALQRARELEMARGMDRERAREMERQRAQREFEERQRLEREREEREERQLHEQQERERNRAIPHRRRTLPARLAVGTMDQGARSVVTELCEIWRGRASDWESPYPSDNEIYSDDDDDMGHHSYHHGGPTKMLLLDSSPPRESSPSLLPPHGARSHFGLVPMERPPAPTTRPRSPAPFPGPRLGSTWAGHSSSNMANGFLLLEAGPLTMEPDMMDEDEGEDMFSQGTSLSRVERRGWSYPMVNPVSEPPRPSRSVVHQEKTITENQIGVPSPNKTITENQIGVPSQTNTESKTDTENEAVKEQATDSVAGNDDPDDAKASSGDASGEQNSG